jgi:hypothetical protein
MSRAGVASNETSGRERWYSEKQLDSKRIDLRASAYNTSNSLSDPPHAPDCKTIIIALT